MATKADRFPKEYFNAAMLKGKPPLVLTIEEERLEEIANPKTGRASDKSVLSFENSVTKLIVNSVNFDLICEVTGETDTANWPGHEIELYVDKTSMGADRVDCVRVRAPGSGKAAPTPKKKAKSALPPDQDDDFNDDIPFSR
jgi:hypothetical protein